MMFPVKPQTLQLPVRNTIGLTSTLSTLAKTNTNQTQTILSQNKLANKGMGWVGEKLVS